MAQDGESRFTTPFVGLRVDRHGNIAEAMPGRTLDWTRAYMAALARGDTEESNRLAKLPKIREERE